VFCPQHTRSKAREENSSPVKVDEGGRGGREKAQRPTWPNRTTTEGFEESPKTRRSTIFDPKNRKMSGKTGGQ